MHYNNLAVEKSLDGVVFDKNSPRSLLQYALGALMYTPANHPTIGRDLCSRRHPHLKTLCLCLEDAVSDDRLEAAEEALANTLGQLHEGCSRGTVKPEELPLLFVRVRTPDHLQKIYHKLGSSRELLSGFALPKFQKSCCARYAQAAADLGGSSPTPVYILPILESAPLLCRSSREEELDALAGTLEGIRDQVLNIRVGGNDLCNLLAVRRRIDQTVYDNVVLADFIKDVVLALGTRFTLSAPVWEYFGAPGDSAWQEGLRSELRLDLLNGFVGKTAIHPCQLELIQESLVVDEADYADAMAVLHWEGDAAVAKGKVTPRMNEERVHTRWAAKTLALAKVYGVRKRAQ